MSEEQSEYLYRYEDQSYTADLDEWDNPVGHGYLKLVRNLEDIKDEVY